MTVTIDIDSGGTFTDGFFTRDAKAIRVKVETTPHDLTVCFVECLEAGAAKLGLPVEELLRETEVIRYSTTIATNTLIQRKGSKVGLLVTGGYERSLYGDQDIEAHPLRPFLLPDMVVGLDERIDEDGRVVAPLDEAQATRAMEQLLDQGARILVASLLHSDRNPAHEQALKSLVLAQYPRHYLGSVPVVLASDLTGRPGAAERTNTAVLSAYLRRDMSRYLYKAEEELAGRHYRKPLLIVHSSGGLGRVAKTTVLDTYNSGPTAGVLGAANIMNQLYGTRDFVTVDVGGTSIDFSVIRDGGANFQTASSVEGIPVLVPMVEIRAIGGGGGAIASVDPSTAELRIGPESAGALPGPSAYNLGGTRPTVTDADVVLGYLNPNYFLGGRRPLHVQKAREAVERHVATPLGVSIEEGAFRIIQAAEEQAAHSIAERLGGSPKEMPLLVFGGAGGVRCCAYAERLGINTIQVFSFNAVFCATGSSTLDVVHLYEDYGPILVSPTIPPPMSELKRLAERVRSMRRRALIDMRGEGFAVENIRFALDLEIAAAENDRILIPSPFLPETDEQASQLMESLFDHHGSISGGHGRGKIILGALRLRAMAVVPHHEFSKVAEGGSADKAYKGERVVFWKEGEAPTTCYDHARLGPGHVVPGPAIIEAEDTTYVVPVGWRYEADHFLNGRLTRTA